MQLLFNYQNTNKRLSRFVNRGLVSLLLLYCFYGCAVGPPKIVGKSLGPIRGFQIGSVVKSIVPKQLVIDSPTIENIGFRWFVEGDSNRNATVHVAYRKRGDSFWSKALPMLRVYHEISNQDFFPYRTGNLFAGSILFLEPATEYEVLFTMADPDGGAPEEPRLVRVKTRSEPHAYSYGRKIQVRKQLKKSWKNQKDSRFFTTILEAYEAARPGDIILIHEGIYTGPFVLNKSGEPGKPIVFQGDSEGKTIIRAPDKTSDIFTIDAADHLLFENIIFRHAKTAINGDGVIDSAREEHKSLGASWISVRGCMIEDVVSGIVTLSENSTNWTISDNIIIGTSSTWYPRRRDRSTHTGVNLYGRGHVVCHNRISDFWDLLAIANFRIPVDDWRKHPVCIDFYNNELLRAVDDCIEADYGSHNVRVYRNRCLNAHTALSVQPFHGGPVYLIRNEVYGVTSLTLKLNNYPAGMIVYNNTLCASGPAFKPPPIWQNGHFRNNLFMGGHGHAVRTGSISEYSSLDYNGYRRNDPDVLIRWEFPEGNRFEFNSLSEFYRFSGFEKHGKIVDYNVFIRAEPPTKGRTYESSEIDLKLSIGSDAIDSGVALPQVSHNFTGKRPDLGCYELGRPMPLYGPRKSQMH